MNKEKFITLTSTCVPIQIENIDTDQIISARFLDTPTHEGIGANLFVDWRKNEEGNPIAEFPLNNPLYKGQILVTGKNFGCGASRAQAALAILDAGFKVVISSFFIDIFKNDALDNGLLPVHVSDSFLQLLFDRIEINHEMAVEVNLEKQIITIVESDESVDFEIDSYKKMSLINGSDDMDNLDSMKDKNEESEKE